MKTNYHTHTTRCMHATGDDEDYVLSAIKGGYRGFTFSFTLTLDADYDQSVPVVTVNGNALTPDASGKYTIVDISANLTVAITGIVRNTTTG